MEQIWKYNMKSSYLVTHNCNINNVSSISRVGQICGKLAYSNSSCQIILTVNV